MRRKIVTVCLAAFLLAACASNPKGIEAAYVSPLKYKDYSCDDIATEAGHIEERTLAVYQRLMSEHHEDGADVRVEDVQNWPALFVFGGNGPIAYELVKLEGEFEALRENAKYKECQIDVLLPKAIRTDNLEQTIREIRSDRSRACPRRSTNEFFCRIEWARAHPEEAAILKIAKDR